VWLREGGLQAQEELLSSSSIRGAEHALALLLAAGISAWGLQPPREWVRVPGERQCESEQRDCEGACGN